MSHKHHSISIHFAQAVVKAALQQGLNEQQLLHDAGLSKALLHNNEVRITPQQLSRLMQSVWRHADDEYLCLGSQPSRHGVFSMMAKQVLPSGNLRQVYRRGSRFYNLVAAATDLHFEESENGARFYLKLADPELDPDHTLVDFLLLLWHRFPSWLIGQKIPLTKICFKHEKPAHFEEYRLMFPCEAVYGQAENYFEFDREILNAPVIQTQQNLSAYLRRCPLDWFQRQSYYPVYTRKVMDYLENAENMADSSMEGVASQIHTTTRTLRRKLLDEGTSFQELKDGVRRDEAIHYLSQPDVPISQIARLLGFTEAAAFTRAFKHWTGISPSMYRKSKE
ncbi:AraC family transcriptional regulator [Amphritea balenae]|uniref:AraC family transcriptional regulator n=1 Tax=Amphritea balenae TaxID=452629 RepID=A0A3P1SXB8_9GAMM|nr:AraC family transcriptional regulator [Amphritea balenae]RRD01698.1 AraC family transcriptional regulator [Amphritea balenae]GGK54926.1 transcriptional regulator [Amphritea balenae]